MSARLLKEQLAQGAFFAVPGVHDMIAAIMAARCGFRIVYGSGYWLTASAYGLPDAGLVGFTQMLDRMATVHQTTGATLIADADTGFGGLLNVRHSVCGYEAAGVAAMQMEDQEFPKRCGHTPNKRVVPMIDMADKIRVAVETRDEMLVIARTDAYQSEGLDGTLRRLEAYAEAGADILFPEAIQTEEEMRKICDSFDKPVMVNISNSGRAPSMSAAALADIGFAFAIYPSMTGLAAAAAMEQALIRLRDTGISDSGDVPLFDFGSFSELIGLDDVLAFERKWARD